MKKIYELLKLYLLDAVRNPVNLFFSIVMMFGVLFVTGFVLNQRATAEIIASYSVFIISYTATWLVAHSIPEERQKGVYRIYRSSRLSKLEYVFSKVLICSLSILFALMVIMVGIFTSSIYLNWLLIPVFILSLLVHVGIGLIIAAFASSVSDAQKLGSLVFVAMIFLSPVFYTTENLPEFISLLRNLIPLTFGVEAARSIMVEGLKLAAVWQEIGILSFLTVVALSVGYRELEF